MKQTSKGLRYAQGIDPKKIEYEQLMTYNDPDRTFAEFGHIVKPTLANANNTIIKSGYRLWKQYDQFKDILNKSTVFYPHEAVESHVNKTIETSLKKHNIKFVEKYFTHNDRSCYWEYVCDLRDHIIKGSSLKVDDVVQTGFIVRNGIQSDTALGIDFFTKRLSCENGAISAARSEGNISISHVGSYEHMKERFLDAIPLAILKAEELIDYYQASAYIKANQKIAEEFYEQLRDKITPKYFPESFNIDPDIAKEQPDNISKIVTYKPKTEEKLWDIFNDFTENLWKSDRLSFTGKRKTETALHQVLIAHL